MPIKNADQENRLHRLTISPAVSIAEAMAQLDKAGTGALVVCDSAGLLRGLLTDGDIRRAILRKKSLELPCETIASIRPITALAPVSSTEALRLMDRHDINHLPILSADGIIEDLLLRRDLSGESDFTTSAPQRLDKVIISATTLIADAIIRLDKAGTGALLLCKKDRILCGLLTDGDLRRAVLQGKSMEATCETVATHHAVTAEPTITMSEALCLMNEHDINHLPLVDTDNRVVDFLLRRDLSREMQVNLSAVIMAGGFGKRLLPLTQNVPKPMLQVGNRPLLELTIQQLRRSGIRQVSLTTHYLPDSIVSHFGHGEGFGVNLNYLKEDFPMGTAGGLRLMKRPEAPFLVINGDILTGVPFQEMLIYHRKHGAVLTVGVRKYTMQVPFGVVECEDVRITSLEEKPSRSFFINAGTYLLEPSACDYLPKEGSFDMTDLIQALLKDKRPVVSFPIMEYWLDVGRHEDYKKAQEDVLKGRF